MRKRFLQRQKTPGMTPAHLLVHCSDSQKQEQEEGWALDRLEKTFASFSDGMLACDLAGKIQYLNASALTFFELPLEACYRGTNVQRFLHSYGMGERHQSADVLSAWSAKLVPNEEGASPPVEKTTIFHLPSGREGWVAITCVPLRGTQNQAVGTILRFHELTENMLHLSRVSEAVAALTEAIASMPADIEFTFLEDIPLLSPPMLYVTQQLVEVLRQVLMCQRVELLALGAATESLYYVAGSGFTPEQEQYRREQRGRFFLDQYADEPAITRLRLDQEVILPAECMHAPTGYHLDFASSILLWVPLFLGQHLAGVLGVEKEGDESAPTAEEIALVKATVAHTILVVECLQCMQMRSKQQADALVMDEMRRLSNEFLTLASHELRTPLTGIKGNLQAAQRRLERLKCQVTTQPESLGTFIDAAQQPLHAATQSARLQQQMIDALLDDARIQAGTFQLHPIACDLRALLTDVVTKQQQSTPTRIIALNLVPGEQAIPILADPGRIKQVLVKYLETALGASPPDQPVAVHLTVEDGTARVSVHDEGAGISMEEQKHLWDRFYRAKGSAVQQELDLSLGLGFYLCKVFIEQHQGSVGVDSLPGQGTTFWLNLPTDAGSEERHMCA